MEGIGTLVAILVAIMLGPPVLFFIIGLTRAKHNRDSAKVFYILAILWLVVGGGICASLMG